MNRNGSWSCGSGSRSASRVDLVVLHVERDRRGTRPRRARPAPRRRERERRCDRVGAHAAASRLRRRRRASGGVAAVHHDGPERDADAVLDASAVSTSSLTGVSSGRVTSMHLAAGRVGEQLDHVGRLLVDRPDPHRVEQPPRREEEA